MKFGYNLGCGLFTLKTSATSTVRELLLLSLNTLKVAFRIMFFLELAWVHGFDPKAMRGIATDRAGACTV